MRWCSQFTWQKRSISWSKRQNHVSQNGERNHSHPHQPGILQMWYQGPQVFGPCVFTPISNEVFLNCIHGEWWTVTIVVFSTAINKKNNINLQLRPIRILFSSFWSIWIHKKKQTYLLCLQQYSQGSRVMKLPSPNSMHCLTLPENLPLKTLKINMSPENWCLVQMTIPFKNGPFSGVN